MLCITCNLKQLLYKVQTKRKEEKARRTCLQWVDFINRDLQEIPNWQKVATDRDAW